MLKRLLIMVVAVGAVAGGLVMSTSAVFTESEPNPTNVFTVGSLAIDDTPDTATFTVAGMVPGDSDTQPITLTNNGTIELRYAMTTAATNVDTFNLRDELTLEIREKAAGTCAADFTGTIVLSPAVVVSSAGALFGDPTQGADAGDRVLAATANEILCFKVELPLAATPTQAATTDVTFTFEAEQTGNNP